MGRLIDADRLKDILEYGILCNVPADAVNTKEEKWNDWVQEVVNKAPTVEAIPKDQYEARLKADIIAILTDLQLDIEECVDGGEGSPQFEQGVDIARTQVVKIIQQKINELKENTDDNC